MRSNRALIALLLVGLLLTGCVGGDDTSDDGAPVAVATNTRAVRAVPTPTAESTATAPAASSPTATEAPGPSPTATKPASPTARPIGTAPSRPIATRPPTETATTTVAETPAPSPASLTLVQQGFSEVQEYDEVAFGFIVENPDGDNAVVNTQYRVIVYEGGTALEETDGYLDLVPPGGRIGVGGSIFIPEGTNADRIDVELIDGVAAESFVDPGFSVNGITYRADGVFPSATAVVSTTYDRPLQDFEVFAVGYDANGQIIGGGYSFVSFILAGGSIGVEVNLASAEEPARVEVYPVMTSLTLFGLDDTTAVEAAPLRIVAEGYGPSSYEGEVGWGFIVENPNTGVAGETLAYHVTAYGSDGAVLGTFSSYVSLLLPGEQLGVGGAFYLPPETTAGRFEFQVLARYFTETSLEPGILTTADATFVADEFSPLVTGVVANTMDRDLADIEVYALAFDAAGQIIGGGFTFVDLIPAGGQADAEVSIAVAGEPARVELYATVSNLTEIE